ncbi:MAG: hypothetical protein AAF553_09525 [Pseudomonadota bacterium]
MNLKRRHVLVGLAGIGAPFGTVFWRRFSRPSLNEAVKSVVQVAFGTEILTQEDLELFAQDLEPWLEQVFPATYLAGCRDWIGRTAPNGVAALGRAEVEHARVEAEGDVDHFTRFIATNLVAATGFGFAPDTRPLPYYGLQEEWPAPRIASCSPLANFSMDDDWPV